MPGWVLFLSIVKCAGTDSELDIINSSSAIFPIWTIPNSTYVLFKFKYGYFDTNDNFIIFEYFCSKIILAFDTKTLAKLGFIFIWISSFFFLEIMPALGSKLNPSAFSILNKIFCSEILSK